MAVYKSVIINMR